MVAIFKYLSYGKDLIRGSSLWFLLKFSNRITDDPRFSKVAAFAQLGRVISLKPIRQCGCVIHHDALFLRRRHFSALIELVFSPEQVLNKFKFPPSLYRIFLINL